MKRTAGTNEGDREEDLHMPALKSQASDYVASAMRAALGAVPFAGSLLAEVAGTIIPSQRIDRVSRFAEHLEEKLSRLNQDFVRSQLTNENFTDLLEEGIRQAARSLSEERRKYLASVITNGLSSEDVEFFESKHLLRILGEINDVEVVILRFHLAPTMQGDEEFRKKHEDVIWVEPGTFGSSRRVLDKETLHSSYQEHLVGLGLLERVYDMDKNTDAPEFSTRTGAMKVRGYEISRLGRMLLRHIDLMAEEWDF